VAPYDPSWPDVFADLAARIRAALGEVALSIEHVGSTSVPGLPAKPVIDIDLTVPDSRDEDAYRSALDAAAFPVLFRESALHEHRFARGDSPPANIHYAAAKVASAEQINAEGGRVMDYNQRQQPVIRDILDRMFRAHGLIDGPAGLVASMSR
jgi:GrpB-like predicted nucleotidyltransferase (UPF0157 family)